MAMNRRHGNQSVVVGRNKQRNVEESIVGVVVIVHDFEKSGPGKSASIQIYSGTELDPSTGNGKTSKTAKLKEWRSKKKGDGSRISNYKIKLKVDKGFGSPGAFVITNEHKHKFYLKSVFLQIPKLHPQPIHFDCNSWVYPFNVAAPPRLFFSNTSYIPSQTPRPLVELRKEELIKLRGDGKRENKEWERIYEYDYYDEFFRPELGESSSLPYPRRGRTVQHPNSDGSMDLQKCVPPDERMRQSKVKEIVSSSVEAALQFLIPTLKAQHYTTNHFNSFVELGRFFWAQKPKNMAQLDQWTTLRLQKFIPQNLFPQILSQKDDFIYPHPHLLEENERAWMDDDEFARQMLAGTNPVRITCLHRFPPECKAKVVSTIKASDIERNLDGLPLQQVYIDIYISSLPLCCSSLNLPAPEGLEAALWQLAKAHVAANDSVYHQLVSHW